MAGMTRGSLLAAAVLAAISLGGCAQLFGLEETSAPATPIDSPKPVDATPIDARACAGGDARTTDPATGHCYILFVGPQIRDNARTACSGLGGNTRLASVDSAGENAVIAALIGTNDAFLGGNDEAIEATFAWEDGTAFLLTNWNTGEPNNALGMFEEDCIVMLNNTTAAPGKWDDRPCAPGPAGTGAYGFVCERP